MTMWLWGWRFKSVLAQYVPHSCHEWTTHRRLNWRGFKKKTCIQRLSQCSFCHKLVGFPTTKKGQKSKNVSRHPKIFVASRLNPSNIQDNMDRKQHAKKWVPNNKNKWNPCQKLKYALSCSGAEAPSITLETDLTSCPSCSNSLVWHYYLWPKTPKNSTVVFVMCKNITFFACLGLGLAHMQGFRFRIGTLPFLIKNIANQWEIIQKVRKWFMSWIKNWIESFPKYWYNDLSFGIWIGLART